MIQQKFCDSCEEWVIPDFGRCPNCNEDLDGKEKGKVNFDNWDEETNEEWGGDIDDI